MVVVLGKDGKIKKLGKKVGKNLNLVEMEHMIRMGKDWEIKGIEWLKYPY